MQPAVPAALAGIAGGRHSRSAPGSSCRPATSETPSAKFGSRSAAAPEFYPAETALGYVELARKDADGGAAALRSGAAARTADDVPALVGRGQALLALNREADALVAFEAALAVDPSLADVRRRVEVLRFRGARAGSGRRAPGGARRATSTRRRGPIANAIASSPDSAFLYRELAVVERRQGNADAALGHFRKALALDPTDASSLVQVGELLDARGDLEAAARSRTPTRWRSSRATRSRRSWTTCAARTELARLPAEYRAIEAAPQITRGDLAALIGVRLAPLLRPRRRRDAGVITDVAEPLGGDAGSWRSCAPGMMDPFENHTFQPRAVVRRVDLAQAMSRLLALRRG